MGRNDTWYWGRWEQVEVGLVRGRKEGRWTVIDGTDPCSWTGERRQGEIGGRQYQRGEERWEGGRSPWSWASDLASWSSTLAEGGKSHWGFTVGTFRLNAELLGLFSFWDSIYWNILSETKSTCWSPSCWMGDFQVWYEKIYICVLVVCGCSVSLL